MPACLTELVGRDIRFPTSRLLDGSDAMQPAPDCLAAYVRLKTDSAKGFESHGLTFTIGRGKEVAVDHLHEHSLDSCVIRTGRYLPPERPRYSIERKADSRRDYGLPAGRAWRAALNSSSSKPPTFLD